MQYFFNLEQASGDESHRYTEAEVRAYAEPSEFSQAVADMQDNDRAQNRIRAIRELFHAGGGAA